MRSQSRYGFVVLLLLVWPFYTSCLSWIASPGPPKGSPPFHDGTEEKFFENFIQNGLHQLDGTFSYRHALDDELRIVGPDLQVKDEALKAPLLLRFAWFSDVQFAQRELKLYSYAVSRSLDDIITSFQYNPAQEDFLWAVYLSQIEAVNRLHEHLLQNKEPGIDFMIHTGDSINAGTIEELYQFIYISDRLKIPWLNLVGNHDLSIFGNYVERFGHAQDPGVIFFPVANLGNFVWMHRRERAVSGYGRLLLPTPSESGHSPSESIGTGKKLPPTSHHGFDWESGGRCGVFPPEIPNYDKSTGDYFADLCEVQPFAIRLIGLNSTKKDTLGGFGPITFDKREWLKDSLLPSSQGKINLNLLFVHHRPQNFDHEMKALLADPNHGPLVVFTGHTHEHNVKRHAGSDGSGYYELNTGSVLEFPQVGRLIELRGNPGGPVWLVSRALWSSLMWTGDKLVREADMPSADVLDIAYRDCVANRKLKRETLADAARCGFYGAYHDYRRDRDSSFKKILPWTWWGWGRRQALDDAWEAANVIIPVSPQGSVTKK